MAFKTLNKTSEYIRSMIPAENGDIRKILEYAESHTLPVLLPESALALRQLVRIKAPQKILEIGTAIGYSGHLMLGECNGDLITLESDIRCILPAQDFFNGSGFSDRVTIMSGDAGESLMTLHSQNERFDFIFMDGPKTKYVKFLPLLKDMLRAEGILVSDNVLFNGMVAGEVAHDPKKRSIIAGLDLYLKQVMSDGDFLTSILPVGDGLSVSIKK